MILVDVPLNAPARVETLETKIMSLGFTDLILAPNSSKKFSLKLEISSGEHSCLNLKEYAFA